MGHTETGHMEMFHTRRKAGVPTGTAETICRQGQQKNWASREYLTQHQCPDTPEVPGRTATQPAFQSAVSPYHTLESEREWGDRGQPRIKCERDT